MVSNYGSLKALSYGMMPAVNAGGRTYVPVKPSQYVYSQFQYVAGVPAASADQGVSVDKIKILNTLIEQLVSMKQKNVQPLARNGAGMTDDHLNALIEQYQGQIKTATANAENLLYKPVMPQSGAVLNLVA